MLVSNRTHTKLFSGDGDALEMQSRRAFSNQLYDVRKRPKFQ